MPKIREFTEQSMCGRFSLTFTSRDLREYFDLGNELPLAPRYNIAPSQNVATIRRENGARVLRELHWGLIPFWAKDRKIGYRTINARAETAHKSPSFRAAFRSRRCLVPANGFYEWDKAGGTRQPYFIHLVDNKPMAFAGLWERWQEKAQDAVVESCTILTTDANDFMARLHNRMPAILQPDDFDLWLDPKVQQVERLRPLLKPAASGILAIYPVSSYVNKATHEGAECLEPVRSPPRS
jgi:putative SOS response-associated peptidase YedK